MNNEDLLYNQYKNFGIIDLQSEFSQACRQGELDKIKFFLTNTQLSKNVDVHYNEDDALHGACSNGHLAVVDYLLTSPELKEHADIHACLDWALSTAARAGNLDIVKYLLTSPKLTEHCDIHADDEFTLQMACASGSLATVEYLLTSSELTELAQIRPENHLTVVASNGHLDIIKFFLESPKLKPNLNVHEENDVIFIEASKSQQINIIQYLIFDLNIDINENINKYLNQEVNSFIKQVRHMFEMRDTNKSLEKELPSDKINQKKPKL
jgi:ankyrin repeat protein